MQVFREIPFFEWSDTESIVDVPVPFSGDEVLKCYSL